MTAPPRPRLYICSTCDPGPSPSGALFDALQARLAQPGAPAVELASAACLANCDRGCSAAIAMPGKWTYLLGRLRPELADDLLTYAASYAASATGAVMPSRRPAPLRHMIMGRVPHLEPFT